MGGVGNNQSNREIFGTNRRYGARVGGPKTLKLFIFKSFSLSVMAS